MADLSHGQAVVEALAADSADIRQLIEARGVRYELLDDYGNGTLLIATSASGDVQWKHAPWVAS